MLRQSGLSDPVTGEPLTGGRRRHRRTGPQRPCAPAGFEAKPAAHVAPAPLRSATGDRPKPIGTRRTCVRLKRTVPIDVDHRRVVVDSCEGVLRHDPHIGVAAREGAVEGDYECLPTKRRRRKCGACCLVKLVILTWERAEVACPADRRPFRCRKSPNGPVLGDIHGWGSHQTVTKHQLLLDIKRCLTSLKRNLAARVLAAA